MTIPSRVNKFEKLEIDFQISGLSGQNLQLPYLTAADANQYTQDFVNDGVTVDAIFFAPNGTQYRQPAFWHEGYDNNLQSTDNSRWTVRFAPHMAGQWTVKMTAVSRDGALESEFGAFTVDDSAEKGFLQVSKNDSRYFEFDNGDYFSNLGFNYSIRALRQSAEAENLSQNGVNYLRVWASRLNIVGGAWSHLSMKPTVYDGYLPRDAVARYFPEGSSDEEFWWRISHNHSWYSSCLYTNQEYERIRVKPNTDYLVQTEFATYDVMPADQSKPYGYSVVIQDWVDHCSQLDGNNGITSYSGGQNQQTLVSSGTWNSGDSSTIPFVYPALSNVSAGTAYIKSISIREKKGDGGLGPELFIDYKADKRAYFSQRESAMLDQIVDQAAANGLYLSMVISEKEDPLRLKTDPFGNPTDLDRDNFYGNGREIQYNRYLQMAWWRYLQARWGYSTAIHSWELLNEGDPFHGDHYALADELGKYMNCTVFGVESESNNNCTYEHPNGHMVSTSFWHSFPADELLRNPGYPNIDYGDQHKYLPASESAIHQDMTTAVLELSGQIGAGSSKDIQKPVIRGETGIVDAGTDGPIAPLRNGNNPVWLHNMLWSSLNSGGVMEAGYWYPGDHIFNDNFSILNHFESFRSFVDPIPLNNGAYDTLSGSFSAGDYPLVGQVDSVNRSAHGWLRHPDFNWKAVDDGRSAFGLSGTLTLQGFESNRSYQVMLQSYSLGSGYVQTTQTITANGDGSLSIPINTAGDVGSVAFKVTP